MATFAYIGFLILPVIILFFIVLRYSMKTNDLPWNWPIIGMLPMILTHYHRLADRCTEFLESSGGTFIVKGLWFTNTDLIFTSDPVNVHHIFSSNFSMYPKGIGWKKRLDIFGNALFNSDFEEWKNHKIFFRGYLSHRRFHELLPKIFEDSMKKKLIPILEHVSKQDIPVDFASLLKGHLFYISCRLATGCDACSSFPVSFHENLFSNAIMHACEAIFSRLIFPESIWKLQKWLGIGKEGKLRDAWKTIDNVLAEQISLKRQEMSDRMAEEDIDFNALELHLIRHKLLGPISVSNSLIRDNMLGLMFATQDTTSTALSWFFWLLSRHPAVEKRIREEIQEYFPENGETKWLAYGAKELDKMVYLHAALCETLRLFPPGPFQSRTPVQNDTLPSGHRINQGQNILICTYAMGRMASVWGEDCREFKPERWITHDGGIKHEPAHKFFAFNAGPRICPGKDVGFTLMKGIASAIIHNYHVKVVENHPVIHQSSIILHMKHGLMVTVKKRWP
ncbi:PREDICTED: alkane hydroxylase MAH1-like [Theobroma cacao]|uniref:Alkane hydroxylase MAH1-like n=1 Tax=Theobroma cacao TaxID=3641 RepID=A0AB32WQH9_THECC|nr:PREDICTED: alkane hydroxylase MAH1-like [Theobroma cacao]